MGDDPNYRLRPAQIWIWIWSKVGAKLRVCQLPSSEFRVPSEGMVVDVRKRALAMICGLEMGVGWHRGYRQGSRHPKVRIYPRTGEKKMSWNLEAMINLSVSVSMSARCLMHLRKHK